MQPFTCFISRQVPALHSAVFSTRRPAVPAGRGASLPGAGSGFPALLGAGSGFPALLGAGSGFPPLILPRVRTGLFCTLNKRKQPPPSHFSTGLSAKHGGSSQPSVSTA